MNSDDDEVQAVRDELRRLARYCSNRSLGPRGTNDLRIALTDLADRLSASTYAESVR